MTLFTVYLLFYLTPVLLLAMLNKQLVRKIQRFKNEGKVEDILDNKFHVIILTFIPLINIMVLIRLVIDMIQEKIKARN